MPSTHKKWRYIVIFRPLDMFIIQILQIGRVVSYQFRKHFQEWNVRRLTFEIDTEPYAKVRDEEIMNLAGKSSVEVVCKTSHTLFSPNSIIKVQ